jgi:hypothetical protein
LETSAKGDGLADLDDRAIAKKRVNTQKQVIIAKRLSNTKLHMGGRQDPVNFN